MIFRVLFFYFRVVLFKVRDIVFSFIMGVIGKHV